MILYEFCKYTLITLLCIIGGACGAVELPVPACTPSASETIFKAVMPSPSPTEPPEIIWQYDPPKSSDVTIEPVKFDYETSYTVLKNALVGLEWEDKQIGFLMNELEAARISGVKNANIIETDELGDTKLYIETMDSKQYGLILLGAGKRVGGIIDFETGKTVFVYLP